MTPEHIEKILRQCDIILRNAAFVPDPQMEGMTDCWAVPLDDLYELAFLVGYNDEMKELDKYEMSEVSKDV